MTHINIRDFKPSPDSVSVESLQTELAAMFAALAFLANECIADGSGSRMLGLAEGDFPSLRLSEDRVHATRLGKLLPVWFKYAYEGVVAAGFDPEYWDKADSALERLSDIIQLLRTDDGYFEDCLSVVDAGIGPGQAVQGHLADLVRRIEARMAIDRGWPVHVEQLALLANMAERSVRNATGFDGDARLELDDKGFATNADALRWLRGRRAFVATQRRELPADLRPVPADSLDAVEIPGFLEKRLKAIWDRPEVSGEATFDTGMRPRWMLRATAEAGIGVDRLDAVTELPLDIRPQECRGLAKAAKLDPAWFTLQVMTALYPDEVDLLLNAGNWKHASEPEADEPPAEAVTVELTESMLAHGYIDLPTWAKQIFPSDCFGTRESDGQATGQVELRYGAHTAMTDIRVKSTKTISPRRRFTAWLNSELGARPGDRIRVERVGERAFQLTHLPQTVETKE